MYGIMVTRIMLNLRDQATEPRISSAQTLSHAIIFVPPVDGIGGEDL